MKKVLLVLIATVTSIVTLNAQVSVGPKVGLNLAKMSDGEKKEENTKEPFLIGTNFGVAANFQMSKIFSLQTELLYSQKGARVKMNETETMGGMTFNYSSDSRTKFSYLEIPVLARTSFGGESFKLYLNAGPSVGFWTGGGYKGKYSSGTVSREVDGKFKFVDEYSEDGDGEILKKDANRIELGFNFGGGALLSAGPGKLMFDVRYQKGLTNLFKKEAFEDSEVKKFSNNVVAISVGYLFTIGGK